MTIEYRQGARLAPEPHRPYWRDANGDRLSFLVVVSGVSGEAAGEAAERHAQAVAAVVRTATLARLRGDSVEAPAERSPPAGVRTIAGFWPHDSSRPIR